MHISYIHATHDSNFSNCKLTVQSNLGPQRLAQRGYSNVHGLLMINNIYIYNYMYTNMEFIIKCCAYAYAYFHLLHLQV